MSTDLTKALRKGIAAIEFEEHVAGFTLGLTRRDTQAMLASGLAGEAGEVADLIKKHLFHGDDLDLIKLEKELGDVLWYWTALCQNFGIRPEDAMQANVDGPAAYQRA